MKMWAEYLLPIRTVAGQNVREHWRKRAARVKHERNVTRLIVRAFPVPATVTMVRLSPGLLDCDNLAGACKAIRDQIAAQCGVDDGPTGPITWRYAQERSRRGTYGVRIEITHPQETK